MFIRCATFCLLLAILLSGCGPAATKLVPVSGKITIQGEPLPWGTITLIPDATKGNTSKLQPLGKVTDGTYTLETDGKPGAPLGAYRVTVSAIKPSTPEDGYKPPVWAASQDYLDQNKSGLTLTVVETPPPGAYDIALTKK